MKRKAKKREEKEKEMPFSIKKSTKNLWLRIIMCNDMALWANQKVVQFARSQQNCNLFSRKDKKEIKRNKQIEKEREKTQTTTETQDSRLSLSLSSLSSQKFLLFSRRRLMSDPAIKLFGKTIPLPELLGGDLTEQQDQNPVRLSDSCTGDDEEMGDSGLAGGGGGDDGGCGDSESQKVTFLDL